MLTIATVSVIITTALVKRAIDNKRKIMEQRVNTEQLEQKEEIVIHAS